MTRTGGIVWIVLGIVAAILLMLGLIYGPDLYRKGESIVAPIMQLTKLDEATDELNKAFPFTPPEDGLASEERLLVFLDVRRQLIPHYEAWLVVERGIGRTGQEDFETAGRVLGSVTDVYEAQIETLRQLSMSPAEFRWLEIQVYDGWLDKVEATEMSGPSLATASEAREMALADLEFVDQQSSRHGSSSALTAVRERLAARLAALDNPSAPEIEGVAPENDALFWRHREAIAELKLEEHQEMHRRLREGSDGVHININRPKQADSPQ
jgi:hypothetical protein